MDNNIRNSLEEIRSTVVNDLTPLMEDSSVDPEQRFLLALAQARNSGSVDQFQKALSIAHEIEDQDHRADALLDLLEELDTALEIDETSSSSESEPQLSEQRES